MEWEQALIHNEISTCRPGDLSTHRPVNLSTCQPVDLYAYKVASDVGIRGVSTILYFTPLYLTFIIVSVGSTGVYNFSFFYPKHRL